jgi:hypothetical protein
MNKHVVIAYKRPLLYPKQEAAIFDPKRISVVEASTKSGKTSGCITWLVERASQGWHGRHYWWVAPVSLQADIAFNRMRHYIKPASLFTAHLQRKAIILSNGAVIEFRSGDRPDSLYGEDVYAAVIDEASRFKQEAWHAVRSTLTKTRGPIRIIGNVKGRKNWFFNLARHGEAGHPNIAYHKLTCWDAVEAGVLDAEEIKAAEAEPSQTRDAHDRTAFSTNPPPLERGCGPGTKA